MTGPNGNVPATVISNNFVGYGDNSIVWVPSGIDKSNNNDVEYTVTLSGIKNAPKTSYSYTVTVIRP
jgi:hypothetical protein